VSSSECGQSAKARIHSGQVEGVLTGDSIVESLLGKVASLVGSIQDLVVEDGEVERKTQTDRVRRRQLSLRNLGSGLVCLERLVRRVLSLVANGELGEIAVVVALPERASVQQPQLQHAHLGHASLTSCDRTPWTRHSSQTESGAYPKR
jgi:hypothetical protein